LRKFRNDVGGVRGSGRRKRGIAREKVEAKTNRKIRVKKQVSTPSILGAKAVTLQVSFFSPARRGVHIQIRTEI
jgi:hypothetical protein